MKETTVYHNNDMNYFNTMLLNNKPDAVTMETTGYHGTDMRELNTMLLNNTPNAATIETNGNHDTYLKCLQITLLINKPDSVTMETTSNHDNPLTESSSEAWWFEHTCRILNQNTTSFSSTCLLLLVFI